MIRKIIGVNRYFDMFFFAVLLLVSFPSGKSIASTGDFPIEAVFGSSSTATTTNCTVTSFGTDTNPYYQWGWRLLNNNSSWVKMTFNLNSVPNEVRLELEHLSSSASGVPHDGYSPVDVIINGDSTYAAAKIFSPGSHGAIVDSIFITDQLQVGQNTIELKFKDAYTHYWIKRMTLSTHAISLPSNPSVQVVFGSSSTSTTTNCSVTSLGTDTNPYYNWGWRLLYNNYSSITVNFDLSEVPNQATLYLEHLSSSSSGAPHNGYSPIDIVVNGDSSYPLVADFSPGSHSSAVDKFNLPALLQTGQNSIELKFKDAYSHYWVKTIALTTSVSTPDLVITTGNQTVTPSTIEPGDTVTLSGWSVKNQGTVISGGFSNGFYLSSDATITSADTYLDGNSNYGLDAGEQFNWGGPTLTIPATTAYGTYYIGTLVDSHDVVSESDENNNYVSTQITVRPLQLPDPVVSILGTENYTVNGINFVRYLLSVDNRDQYPDALFAAAPDLPPCGLNNNASRTWVDILDQDDNYIYGFCGLGSAEDLSGLWFAVEQGTTPPTGIRVRLWDRLCDPNLEAPYTSELITIPVSVSAPDLVITTGNQTVTPSTIEPGGTVTLSGWSVKNQGTVISGGFSNGFYLSSDATITSADTYLDGNSNYGLDAGEQFNWGGPTLTIPATTAYGTYYIGTLVDSHDVVSESDENNNYVSTQITINSTANQPPVIDSFTADLTQDEAPLSVSFTCQAYDPDGTIAEYHLNYGDGTSDSATGTFNHTYNNAGTYQAICTVVDNDGARVVSDSITITVTRWQTHYSCSQSCGAQCGGDIPCMVECSQYWQDCCQDGLDICQPCPPVDPPSMHRVGFCDQSCQAGAPMTVAGGVMGVNFNYTAPVEVIAGVMSSDFTSVWWLTDSCTLSEDFGQAVNNAGQFSCTNVTMPLVSEQGWVFWLVAPTASADMGADEWWNTGVYELMWYQLP